MKKSNLFIAILLLFFIISLLLSSCNKQVIDLTYSYDRAIISLPNGAVVDGKVSSWKDFEDGDQIQVVVSGTTYLVHSSNVALIKE